MRDKKSFLFHNEEGAEKNTVQALLKTLQDTRNAVTVDFLELATGVESAEWGTDLQFEYRTEVTESKPKGEARYLVGLSTENQVRAGDPGEKGSQVDARIRVYDGEERQATIFIEAKVGSNPLREAQLRRYVNHFEITETGDEEGWTRIQWADVYTTLRKYISSQNNERNSRSESVVNEYLLTEFTDWLRYQNQILHRVGEGTTNTTYPKHLNVGISDEGEYYIQLSAETREERNQSGTATISEPVWKRFLDKIDEQIRRETFGVPTDTDPNPDPDLGILRDWLLTEQGYSEDDFKGQGNRWVWVVDRSDYPLKVKLRRGNHLWVRTKPNVHYCPNLSPDEFTAVFGDVDPTIREDVFIDGELEPLWGTTE